MELGLIAFGLGGGQSGAVLLPFQLSTDSRNVYGTRKTRGVSGAMALTFDVAERIPLLLVSLSRLQHRDAAFCCFAVCVLPIVFVIS